ncbi:hypothetical protein GIB67_005037 [Kingdonia uniflora]|uniref:Uncharacterized protein n=1 Tax=Kingdonia uniflora TaxID=39325 RepID=A0A7J7NMS3_9MAGN|nr:hypothetical protein GIB67_005037 [Kingdonia uniflora]
MKAYASVVYPVVDKISWVKPPREFRPPLLLRPTGKPRKSRRKDEDELSNGLTRRCSKCEHYGHNKKTCKGPPVADKVVHNNKKLTRVDTPRSQEEIKAKFRFSTPSQGSEPRPSTATLQKTQTCRREWKTQQKTSNQSSKRERQQNASTRINSTQRNAKGTQSKQSVNLVRGNNQTRGTGRGKTISTARGRTSTVP